MAVLQRHRPSGAANDLVKLLRTENELWAARALGETAGVETAQELNNRVAEIDAQLNKLGKTAANRPAPKRAQKKPDDEKSNAPETFALVTAAELKNKPEDVRLALLRGELDGRGAQDKIPRSMESGEDRGRTPANQIRDQQRTLPT